MIRDELIEALEELLRCCKYQHYDDTPVNREIEMWRKRFLVENLTEKELQGTIPMFYFAIPSENFIKKSPEHHLEDIKNYPKVCGELKE